MRDRKKKHERFARQAEPQVSKLLYKERKVYYFCPNCAPEMRGSLEERSFLIRGVMSPWQ